jgi:hypothetical protein
MKKFEFCGCIIRDSLCLNCKNVIGYHIVQVCELCVEGGHNQHFWMFQNVKGELIENLYWNDLNPIEKFDKTPVVTV